MDVVKNLVIGVFLEFLVVETLAREEEVEGEYVLEVLHWDLFVLVLYQFGVVKFSGLSQLEDLQVLNSLVESFHFLLVKSSDSIDKFFLGVFEKTLALIRHFRVDFLLDLLLAMSGQVG